MFVGSLHNREEELSSGGWVVEAAAGRETELGAVFAPRFPNSPNTDPERTSAAGILRQATGLQEVHLHRSSGRMGRYVADAQRVVSRNLLNLRAASLKM